MRSLANVHPFGIWWPAVWLAGILRVIWTMNEFADRQTYQMLRNSFQSARMAMAITDPQQADNPLVFINGAFTEMTGYEAADILGRNCRFLQGSGTEEAPKAQLRKALSERRDIEVDLLNYRRSGEPFYNRLFISPVFNEQKQLIHFFSSQLDVTAQKRSESISRRREDVLRQISGSLDERLRTTLDTVQGIVRSALSEASSVVSATEDISVKLMALGHIHRSLLQEDWSDFDLRGVVEAVISAFSGLADRFQLEGPRAVLDPSSSFKIAALVHDLCVASIQRGALGAKDGTVEIQWSIRHERDICQIEFCWHDLAETAGKRTYHSGFPWTGAKLREDSRCQLQRKADGSGIVYTVTFDVPSVLGIA